MQGLTPQQIVLLALFVSFVTSIATGIFTVSLLEQAPDPVVQTINQVVERTVERVVPSDSPISKIINTQSKTVVISDSELATQAVEKVQKSLVRIYQVDRVNRIFVGFGLVFDVSGKIVVERALISKSLKYEADYSEGKVLISPDVYPKDATTYVTMKPAGDTSAIRFEPAKFIDVSKLKLAQQVISLSGASRTVISAGSISDLIKDEKGNIIRVATSIDPTQVNTGSPIIDLAGQVVGMHLSPYLQNQFNPVYIPSAPVTTE